MYNEKRTEFAPDYKSVITTDGEKVPVDDPRVAHVFALDFSPYALEYIKHYYEARGMRCRVSKRTSAETLQSGKALSNGRECVPVVATLGEIYEDITRNRQDDEITIYYSFSAPGPCQHGGWPIMYDTFHERLQLKNIIFLAWPTRFNNYMGNGYLWSLNLRLGFPIGDLMDEAENTVRTLATDPEQAMKLFKDECTKALKASSAGLAAMESALRAWATAVRRIPLKAAVEDTPKMLIAGGANIWWLHYEVTDYFINRGIIPKLVDMAEFLNSNEQFPVTEYLFKLGKPPAEQGYNVEGVMSSLTDRNLSPGTKVEGEVVLDMMTETWVAEHFRKWLRGITVTSGLLFDEEIELEDLYNESITVTSPVSGSEGPNNIAKYHLSAKSTVYDGIVNLRVFNCPIAGGTIAIVQTAANETEMPFVAIDVEGPTITANQQRLLETVLVQAVRNRNAKNHVAGAELSSAACGAARAVT
jgi:predicted nucleotide-binding protein (sugar kinase/HSP70/actin superfamily)